MIVVRFRREIKGKSAVCDVPITDNLIGVPGVPELIERMAEEALDHFEAEQADKQCNGAE